MKKFALIGTPAYGRKYDSSEEVLRDWHAGKDFYSIRGYFSIRDQEYIQKHHDFAVIQWGVGKEVVVRGVNEC